ncbi:MAG: hypothetical protein IT437_00295 [Phycisphaerales bacterium]|nr:hypothetical protein [Phycisphaerales bacterium]
MNRPAHIRRAMTFIEVVAAVGLLGVVAAALLGLLGFLTGSQSREAQQLAAAELGNRLILMYMDDPASMPPGRDPIAYGPAQYRFEYKESPLELTEARPQGRTATRTQSPMSNTRFVELSVHVWLSERSGGAREPDAGAPGATLTRIMDPVAMRNPDSMENLIKDPARWQEWMNRMGGFSSGGGGGGVGGGARPEGSAAPPGRAGTPRSGGKTQ